ncbi:MAG: Hsp20 family protein, partial [Blastocatellia bacterium]
MSSSKIAIKTETQETERTEGIEHPTVVEGGRLFDRMRDISQNIARRAFELFESRGRHAGRALDDWLRAELDILRSIPIEIRESGNNLIVHAEVPGFSANDIDVSVEPRRVLINGKTSESDEQNTESVVYSERSEREVFRSVDLPVEVNTATATATLRHGVLELTMAKVPSAE